MSKEDFRRELNNTFDQMSGSPSPGLRDRVRSSIAQAPEARGPFWIATIAAAVIAVVIIGVLFVANPARRPTSNAGPGVPTASPSASPGGTPTPSPSPTPDAQLPAFTCAAGDYVFKETTPPVPTPAVAYISALRTGTHGTYDRITIEFSNGMPGHVQTSTHSDTTFTESPSGMSATLRGRKGILVVIHGADLHSAYKGSVDIVTGYANLAEVKRLEDFEGVVQLGLGVNGTGCYRAFFLTNPNRLVIDIEGISG
ncbi:MAG: hypothetical protein E6I71_14610 [Chloroflexi bacterium]|nr:MAG: hypothetical protein E6I71_14610 [Chloroflexota bacterium]